MMVDTEESKELIEAINDVAEFDYEVYAELTRAARLQEIRLMECSYSIKPEVLEALEDLENLVYFGMPSGFHFDGGTGVMVGHYRWTAEVKLKRKKVLKLVSEYLIVYTGMIGFEDEYSRFYFEKVGRFSTYPYFRSDFSHHSAASGIMLPPLPSLNERVD